MEGLSIEAQQIALKEWARAKDYVPREFVDAGKSAWTEDIAKRPGFKEMIAAARAGELDGIAVTHLDRFSRKLLVTLTILGELGKRGVRFVCLENATFDFSRPADSLLLAVLGAFAQYYSDELSRKVRRGLALRASKGLKVGTLEFGYCNSRCVDCKNSDPPCPRWETIPKDAPAILHPTDSPGVVLAFETYRRENASYDDIATTLNTAGYRSRTPHGRVLWNRHSVAELLRNISYTGVVQFKGQEIAGLHPAIISRELFDEVEAIRRKRQWRTSTFTHKHRVYLFNGIIKCSGCGRPMRAQAKGRGDHKRKCYHCTSRELRHVDCPKPSAWVNEDSLTDQFEQIVGQFRLPEDWRTRVSEIVNANGKHRNTEADRRTLTERLARVTKQFKWGDISEVDYVQQRDEIKVGLAALKTPEAKEIIVAADYMQNMARVWQEATDEERRDMTRAILDEVICDPEMRRLIALRPKAAFRLLFRQIRGLVERDGAFEIT
jgi:site-specific DNA recombinase